MPIESVQAQSSSVPVVSEVILTGWALDSSGLFDMEVVHSSGSGAAWGTTKYCWSGVYEDSNDDRGWRWVDAEDYSYLAGSLLGYHTSSSKLEDEYYHPANLWEYYICKIAPFNWSTLDVDTSSGWVEVWFWTGWRDPDSGRFYPPSVSVYDSEGNFYYPTLTIK